MEGKLQEKLETKEIEHLQKCAALLHNSSPVISRHISSLLLARVRRTGNDETESSLAEKLCGTCGTIAIVGQTAVMEHKSRGKRRQQPRGQINVITRRRRCLQCQKTQTLPAVKKTSRAAMLAAQKKSTSSAASPNISSRVGVVKQATAAESPLRPVAPSNTKSKERKKNRSKGLASLLAASKASTVGKEGSTGLDLSDFMI